jgi:hypothetical protein
MSRKAASVLLSWITGACLFAQQQDNRTNGWLNGRGWKTSEIGVKYGIVLGMSDAFDLGRTRLLSCLAEGAKATMTPQGAPSAATKQIIQACNDLPSIPGGTSYGDVVLAIDKFYEDTTNTRIPIVYAFEYVGNKIKGAPPADLETLLASLRRAAAAQTQ